MKDRRHDVARFHRSLGRESADGIAFAHHASALHATAGEGAGKTLRPVIASTGRVDLGRAPELRQGGHHRVVEQPALVHILDQCAVALVVHRGNLFLHLLDGDERLRAVDVPRELIEDSEEAVDRDHADAIFDEPPGEQTALAEAVHAVAFAHGRFFLGDVERGAGLFAGHHAEGGMKTVVEQSGVLAGLEIFHRTIDDFAHLSPSIESRSPDLVGRQQVGHLEILLRRVGVEGERVVRLAEETAGLTVGHIAAAAPHQLRQHDKRRQVALAAQQVTGHRPGVRSLDAAGEAPAGLHDLPASIVHRRAAVVNRPHERKLVGDLRVPGENLRDVDVGRLGADRLERPANLPGRIRFHVPQIDVTGSPEIEDHDAGTVVVPGPDGAGLLRGQQLRQRQPGRAKRADLQKLPAFQVTAPADGGLFFSQKIKHNLKKWSDNQAAK